MTIIAYYVQEKTQIYSGCNIYKGNDKIMLFFSNPQKNIRICLYMVYFDYKRLFVLYVDIANMRVGFGLFAPNFSLAWIIKIPSK